MTNEEKAREIGLAIGKGAVNVIIATTGALEMAEWKDKQFKEYLEKLKDKCDKEYEEVASNDEYEVGEADGRLCMVVEIINELFKEEKK